MSNFYLTIIIIILCVITVIYVIMSTLVDESERNEYLPTPTALTTTPAKARVNTSSAQIEPTSNLKLSLAPEIRQARNLQKTQNIEDRNLFPSPAKLDYTDKTFKYSFQSEARDTSIYPTSSVYRVYPVNILRNVYSVNASLAVIPCAEYNVNQYNQWLDILFSGVTYAVKIPVGQYTADATFSAAIETAITTTDPALAAFTASFNTLTFTITINSNGLPFSLLFFTGVNVNQSCWKVLGFPRIDTEVAASITGPGIVDLNGEQWVYLFIDEFTNALENSAVAVFPLNKVVTTGAAFFTQDEIGPHFRLFHPIGRLPFLTFRFLVFTTNILSDGLLVDSFRPYDFNGRQNSVQLNFFCYQYHNVLSDSVELDIQN